MLNILKHLKVTKSQSRDLLNELNILIQKCLKYYKVSRRLVGLHKTYWKTKLQMLN